MVDLRPHLQKFGGSLPMIGRGMMTAVSGGTLKSDIRPTEVDLHAAEKENAAMMFQHDSSALRAAGREPRTPREGNGRVLHQRTGAGHVNHVQTRPSVEIEGHQIQSPPQEATTASHRKGSAKSRRAVQQSANRMNGHHPAGEQNQHENSTGKVSMQPKLASRKVFDEMVRTMDTGKVHNGTPPKKPSYMKNSHHEQGDSVHGRRANLMGSQAFQRAMKARGVPLRAQRHVHQPAQGIVPGLGDDMPAGKSSFPLARPLTHQVKSRSDQGEEIAVSPTSAPHDLLGQGVLGHKPAHPRAAHGRVDAKNRRNNAGRTLGWPVLS